MKKILLSLALLSASFSCKTVTETQEQMEITDINAFCSFWAQAAVTDLTQEELQLLGAFLYFDVTSSEYELALRNLLLDVQRGSQILAFKLMNFDMGEQTQVIITKLKELLEKIEKEIAPSRNYFLACWQECNKEIDESDHQNLKNAIEQLRFLGQNTLNNWSKTNHEEIIKLFEKSSSILDESINKMTSCKTALDKLVDNTFPISGTEFLEIQTVHNGLGISHVLYETLFRASLATDEVMGVSFGLINLNMVLFNSFYSAFYKELEEKNMLPMHIVINELGLIPAENRSQNLPQINFFNGQQ